MAKRKAARATGRKKAAKRGARTGHGRGPPAQPVGERARLARVGKTPLEGVPPARAPSARAPSARAPPARAYERSPGRQPFQRHLDVARGRPRPPKRLLALPAPFALGGKRTTILASVRKVPALDRERRVISDDDLFPMPPSSLNPASSARTERREVVERFHDHTETSPALTGGDVDADWVNIYVAGDDEVRGGDDPTPGQDVLDDIGKSIGVQHEDTEKLKDEAKLSDRDKKRGELDPASAEDSEDR